MKPAVAFPTVPVYLLQDAVPVLEGRRRRRLLHQERAICPHDIHAGLWQREEVSMRGADVPESVFACEKARDKVGARVPPDHQQVGAVREHQLVELYQRPVGEAREETGRYCYCEILEEEGEQLQLPLGPDQVLIALVLTKSL